MQLIKRIDRVRRPRPQQLEVGDREALIASDRQPAELEPVLGARLVLDRLVRRHPGGDQHHQIETELNVRLLAAHEVTKMWRIEAAAENPDAH